MLPARVQHLLTGRRLDWTLLACALVVSVAPVRMLRPWTNDLARLVLVPFVPVTHLGTSLRDRIRPSIESFDPKSPETIALEAEVERMRTLYETSRLDALRLEEVIRGLQATSTRAGGGALLDVGATTGSVVAGDPNGPHGVVRINAGSRHGVAAGSAVFVGGDVFAGLVTHDVGAFISTVLPSTRLPSIGCRLFPVEGSDPARTVAIAPGAVLKPTGRGTWTAEVASAGEIAVGMIARVTDERLPRSALGARIGRIVAVEPIEQVPLARRIEVEPITEARDAISAVVVIERRSDGGEGGPR